jgi:hypothetical protein
MVTFATELVTSATKRPSKGEFGDGGGADGGSGEQMVPKSDYRALQSQVRELQRLLGKKTLEAEILNEALSSRPLLPDDKLGAEIKAVIAELPTDGYRVSTLSSSGRSARHPARGAPCLTALMGCERRRATEAHALRLRAAGGGSGEDQLALELGQPAEHGWH